MSDGDTSAPVCPRCGHRNIRPLGDAHSTLEWFTCQSCRHVWAEGVTAPGPEASPASRRSPGDPRQHILLVDDDTAVLAVLARMLADYRVTAARSADEALSILSTDERVDLLLTDYLMPEVTGEELVARARRLRPRLPVLFITAHPAAISPVSAVFASESHVAKPVEMVVLTQAVLALIGPPLPPTNE